MKRIGWALMVAAVLLAGCGKQGQNAPSRGTTDGAGTLVFTANGEDFVREGFVDKHGWAIAFENVFVNLNDPTAYGEPGEAVLEGTHWVDLAAGDEEAEPVVVGRVADTPAGNYQSLRFGLRRRQTAPYEGASIVLVGVAEKGDRSLPFEIRLSEEMDFDGKDGYVGDEIKGMLAPDGESEVEMTFHFDHIFGDAEAADDGHINTGAVGFGFFAEFAEDGEVSVSQAELSDAKGFAKLMRSVWSLGHLGEGHCACSNQTSAALVEPAEH
jgi:hypothetical protein